MAREACRIIHDEIIEVAIEFFESLMARYEDVGRGWSKVVIRLTGRSRPTILYTYIKDNIEGHTLDKEKYEIFKETFVREIASQIFNALYQ